jgi:hypothetical protein
MALVTLGALTLIGWRVNILGIRTASPVASVAAAFDPPPSYPGYEWMRNGHPVSPEELVTAAGPAHCGGQSATYLTIGWPLGTVSTTSAQARLYIRDPNGVVSPSYRQLLGLHATLPSDARPTGYSYGSIKLYLSPSDQDQAIYVIGPAGAERWPRSDPMALCS